MADLDAVNLAMLSRKTGDLFNVWGDYFAGIEGETINRASEFAKNPGNGNLEKGQKKLKKEVDNFIKEQQYKNNNKKIETKTAQTFLDNILAENNELMLN